MTNYNRIYCEGCNLASINGVLCHETGCFDVIRKRLNGRQYSLVRYLNYFDVWGSAKQGYEVNDQCSTNKVFWLGDDWNDKRLIKELKTQDIIGKNTRNTSLSFEGDDRRLEINIYPMTIDQPFGALITE